jgi:uncharacterized membrane protein YphA (DoxX/SURF4 family)
MRFMPWLGTLARLILGAVFLAAAVSKLADFEGSGNAVAAYRIVPYDIARMIGGMLPFLEIVLGLLLIVGLATRLAAWLAAGLLAVYLTAIVSVWVRGLSIACGCFGQSGAVAGGASGYLADIVRDAALLALAGYLIWHPRTRYGLDRRILAVEEV